nr:hypothetical protein SUGSMm_28460 [Morganella morganii subsp. sibonii]
MIDLSPVNGRSLHKSGDIKHVCDTIVTDFAYCTALPGNTIEDSRIARETAAN